MATTSELEALIERQKLLSAQIGGAKQAGEDATQLIEEHARIGRRIAEIEKSLASDEDRAGEDEAHELSVQVVESAEDFTAMRDDWQRLEEDSDNYSVFLSWEWLHTWWEVFGADKRLHIITVREGGRLVGLLPLMRVRAPWATGGGEHLAFIGTGERPKSDYLGLMAASRGRSEITAALVEALLDDLACIGLAVLHGMACDGEAARAMLSRAIQEQVASAVTTDQVTVHGPLPSSYSEFLADVPSKTRRKRLRNRPERLGEEFSSVRYEEVTDPAEIDDVLEALARFSTQQFGRGLAGSAWVDRRFREFMRRCTHVMAERGTMRLDRLTLDGATAAAALGYPYRDTYFSYQASFDGSLAQREPGHCLFGHVIGALIRAGAARFEFGRGAHDYKTQYFDGRTRLITVRLAAETAGAFRRIGWSLLGDGLRRSAKALVSSR